MNDLEETNRASGIALQPSDPLKLIADQKLDPLFSPAPRSGVASAWYGHVPFARWLAINHKPRCLVELGTHNGVSYSAFCQAIKDAELDTRCFAIDTWQGDEHAGAYGDEVWNDFRAFHDARYSGFSELVRSTFDNALNHFPTNSIDLLHIDGLHTYEAVRHDFEAWRPKLSSRAIVLFHDTNVRERDFGVWRFWAELREQFPNFEFVHEHGLGVLGVGNDISPEAGAIFSILSAAQISTVRNRFAFSGRCCIAEAEVATLRGAKENAERLTGQLNDTHKLAQEIADQRDALRAELGFVQDAYRAAMAKAGDTERLRFIATRSLKAASAALLRHDSERRVADAELANAHAQVQTLQAHLDAAFSNRDDLLLAQRSLENEIAAFRAQLACFEASTAWRATWPARAFASRMPVVIRRAARATLKGVWRAVTIGRPRLRLPLPVPAAIPQQADNAVQVWEEPPISAAVTHSRFSLQQLPQLKQDYTAAVQWYDPITPEVSIIVLNWNRAEMTRLCLQHVWQRTTGRRYEIIVVDNGSSPDDIGLLETDAALSRIICLGTNRYFGEANNIGAEAARGKYICLLNNDAFVHEGWLLPLIETLEREPDAGAAGPRFLYPNGILQEAGVMTAPDGNVIQLGKGMAADTPQARTGRPVDYVSAACCLMRRQDFFDVLGFDLIWDPAYYEDADLGLKLKLIGRQTYYCPDATVTHIEGATSSDSGKALRLDNIIAINIVKFRARWGDFLRSNGAIKPNLLAPYNSMSEVATGFRIVLFTPYNLTPGGGERYLLTIAEALRSIGKVALVTPHPFSRIRLVTLARDFGLDLDHVELLSLDKMASAPQFDLSFIMGNEIVPPIGRIARANIYYCQFPFPIGNKDYFVNNKPYLYDVSGWIVNSLYVRRHVLEQMREYALPERTVQVLYPPVPMLGQAGSKRMQILNVGRFFTGGHCKQQHIMIDVFRSLVMAKVEAELHFAGSIPPEAEHRQYYAQLVEQAADLPVYFHPNCPVEELNELYQASSIYWHATGLGHDLAAEPHKAEHFGISIVEAMSAGCIPVVLAAGGPAEIVEHGVTGFLFEHPDELGERTRSLLQDTSAEMIERLRDAAMGAAQAYSEKAFKEQLLAIASPFLPAFAEV